MDDTAPIKKDFALTTSDNPFNPITQFDDWYAYDTDHGYFTCEYLARIAYTSPYLSDFEYDSEVERAIDEIIEFDLIADQTNGKVHYKKISNQDQNNHTPH